MYADTRRDNHLELHLSHIANLHRLKNAVAKYKNDADRHGPIVPNIDGLLSYADRVERCIVHVPPPRSFAPPSRARPVVPPSRPRSFESPSRSWSFDESSSAYTSSSSVASRTDSTLSSARSDRGRARGRHIGGRVVPSLNRTAPSPITTRRVVTDVDVRLEGRTVWLDGFQVEMEDVTSAEEFKREIENNINILTAVVRWLNGYGARSSSTNVGKWQISR